MVGVGINVDLSEIDRALADVDRRSHQMAPAFRELRKPLRADQREHDRAQEGPDGTWPPRSPATEAKRRARNRRARTTKAMRLVLLAKPKRRSSPKKILGRLPKAFIVKAGDLYVRATSRVPWSGAHQGGWRVGRGVQLPQRIFLWLSDALIDKATEVLGSYVVKGWKR